MPLDFEALIAENYNRLKYIARNYGDSDTEEDLYQEILVQLWRSHGNFRGESKIETWIYKIAINTSMTYQRKRIKDREGKESIAQFSTKTEEPHGLCQAEVLARFMSSINEIDRAVLMMYLDGIPTDDMENILGINSNAIHVRIARLKKKFNDEYVD